MLIDSLTLLEGSKTKNLILPIVTKSQREELPFPNVGEIVYQSDDKQGLYIYNGTSWKFSLDTTNIASLDGILPLQNIPAFDGDVYSVEKSNVLTLKEILLDSGDFNYVTVNKKGQVILGKKVTKISELGIDDVYTKTETDNIKKIVSINDKSGIISKLEPSDISGLSSSATIDTTNADNITTGKLSPNIFPTITGDLVASNITNTLNLSLGEIIPNGDYNYVTVNKKGLVTAGFKHTKISELGIDDVYTKTQVDNISRIISINGKFGIISKLDPTDINGLSPSATIDTTNASNITSGTLSKNRLPALFGDVLLDVGTDQLTLKELSPTLAGNYNYVSINNKGLVTSAIKHTKINDLGIDDVYTKTNVDDLLGFKEDKNKKDVVNGYAGLDVNAHLKVVQLPELSGDVLRTAGTNQLTLKELSPTLAGNYNYVSINNKGLVTAGIKQTKILELGIDDVYTKDNVNTLLNFKEDKSDKNTPDGYAGLDNSGKLLTSLLPSFGGDITSEVGDNRIFLKDILAGGTFIKTAVNNKGLVTSGTTTIAISDVDNLQTSLDNIVTNLKGNVPNTGDTLKKLYDLIIAGYQEIVVDTIALRDAYDVKTLPTNIMVKDDGDGRWGLYKALTTGVNAQYVKISDPDLLNAGIGYESENVINKSSDTTLGGNASDDIKYPTIKAVKSYVDNVATNINNKMVDKLPLTIYRRSKPTIKVDAYLTSIA